MPTFQVELTPKEEFAEIWRPVSGYEGHYEVSDFGRVQSLKNYHGFLPGRILALKMLSSGYVRVTLSLKSKMRQFYVHDLVAAAFIGPKPQGKQANHENGKKWDNRAENLNYKTPKENQQHAVRTGLAPSFEKRSATMKRCAARGDRNGAKRHPERLKRGDEHWTRRNPGVQAGEKNYNAKLSDSQRRAMREVYSAGDISYRLLGEKFGVSPMTAWHTVNSELKSDS